MSREFPLPRMTSKDMESLVTDMNLLVEELELLFRIEDLNSVSNYGTGWSDGTPPVKWYRDPMGRVHLEGLASHAGPTAPDTIFTLPVEYRPGQKYTASIDGHTYEVDTDGTVDLTAIGTWGGDGILSGISFFADN